MGGRNDSKNVTLNGVTILDTGSNGGMHSMPSMDSVGEVKVLMSAYSAESGRNPPSINIATKGGSKQFHGSAGYYVCNEALNANDFFNNKAGRKWTPYLYNIGSYSMSGPVLIPKWNRIETATSCSSRSRKSFKSCATAVKHSPHASAARNKFLVMVSPYGIPVG